MTLARSAAAALGARLAAPLLSLGLSLGLAGCPDGAMTGADAGPLGDGFAFLTPIDETTLVLSFTRDLAPESVTPSAFSVTDYTEVPPLDASVLTVDLSGPREVTVGTSALVGGRSYTLVVEGLADTSGDPIAGTLNFVAVGVPGTVDIEFVVSDVDTAREWDELVLLVSVCEGGAFCEQLQAWPLVDEGDRFVAALPVQVDPHRTLSPVDDADPRYDGRPYAARVVDGAGRMASPLTAFVVPDFDALRTVELTVVAPPEVVVPTDPVILPPAPTDPAPGDGLRVVQVVIDDRAARELEAPSLKVSFDASGSFDVSFPQTLALEPLDGEYEGWWALTLSVAVDPNRVVDGETFETFPYFAYLVEDGVEYEGLSVSVVAPDETPATLRLFLGDPEWTPVTFQVDVGGAYVTADGSVKGHFPGEAVFLTGEWQAAVDALGNNCGDAFSGGEQLNLRMREVAGHPGVWRRTLWLPPGRPYGWKVVRCAADTGCGPLNQLVASAGRAFATVMKNLVTDNVDAFADAAVGLVDPLALDVVEAGGTTWDYTGASVYQGEGMGSEPDPAGTPDGARLFKQEVPDLVVVVGDDPVVTRVFHVGTWRDVNLGQTPAEIIDTAAVVELNPFDYDDGFVGRYPPSREAP